MVKNEFPDWARAIDFQTFLKIKFQRPEIPKELVQMFPLWLVFYRKKPGKKRNFKNKKTASMNEKSVYVYYAGDAGFVGTINRLVRHKGHGKLVASYLPTPEENEYLSEANRICRKSFKSFDELYLLRKVFTPDFKALTEHLANSYKCNSTGQTRMF